MKIRISHNKSIYPYYSPTFTVLGINDDVKFRKSTRYEGNFRGYLPVLAQCACNNPEDRSSIRNASRIHDTSECILF